MQVAKFDVRCPRWALPREEVPIKIKIEKATTAALREVVFELPESLRLADTINVLDREERDGRTVVKAIDTARRSEYDYFGIVVATKEPFKDLKKEVPVKASFFMKDGSVDTCVTPVRIFRPRLEFADAPDVLSLADGGPNGHSVPIRLKFSGFGDITVRARCTIGGRIVSRGTSLLDEILERFLRDPVADPDGGLPGRPAVEVDPEAVALIAEEFRGKLLSDDSIRGMLSTGKIDEDAARMLHRLADSDKERIMNHIHTTMLAIVAGILSDIVDRTLGENLQLESKTAFVPPAGLPVDKLVVEFRYADVLGNEYDPIRRTIQINDRRSAKTGVHLEMPLAITADESGAYKDVGEMAIESRH